MSNIEKLIILSNPDELQRVDEAAERIAIQMGFSQAAIHDIAIAVSEAVNNAIMHGNNADTNKKVQVTFQQESDKLIIRVQDEGLGFEPESIQDPTAPENILREKGRGLFIIRNLMDELQIINTDTGLLLVLTKFLFRAKNNLNN